MGEHLTGLNPLDLHDWEEHVRKNNLIPITVRYSSGGGDDSYKKVGWAVESTYDFDWTADGHWTYTIYGCHPKNFARRPERTFDNNGNEILFGVISVGGKLYGIARLTDDLSKGYVTDEMYPHIYDIGPCIGWFGGKLRSPRDVIQKWGA